MARPPKLNQTDARVLKIVSSAGIVRGNELMRKARLSRPEHLKKAVTDLLKADLIDVSGNPFDENEIRFAVFSTRPSKKGAVQDALKKAL